MATRSNKRKPKTIGSSQFDSKRFGAAVRGLRESHGLSPADFARATGITRQGVAVLESGSAVPTIPTVEKVARHFNLTIIELIGLGSQSSQPGEFDITSAVALFRKLDNHSRNLAISLLKLLQAHQRK